MKELRVLRGEIPASLLSKSSSSEEEEERRRRALTFCDMCLKYLRSNNKNSPKMYAPYPKCEHPKL
tara:strand:- start:267 stop:464 length:198 start_codon:yes stop_codon:yes gene_type:complete